MIKTLTSRDWENVEGTMWRANRMLMDNHRKKHKTLVGLIKRELNGEMDEQIFTERFILTGKHTQ